MNPYPTNCANFENLPPDLVTLIGSEKKDFAVKAHRTQPLKKSFAIILLGIVWIISMMIIGLLVIGPIFPDLKEISLFKLIDANNISPIIIPSLCILALILIGRLIVSFGIYSIFKKGGYFIGTPSKLLHYKNGKIKHINWHQFSGHIKINNKSKKGDISLQLKKSKIKSPNNSPKYLRNVIHISGITNTLEIEQICRKRIKENNPTPIQLATKFTSMPIRKAKLN